MYIGVTGSWLLNKFDIGTCILVNERLVGLIMFNTIRRVPKKVRLHDSLVLSEYEVVSLYERGIGK